VEIRVLGPLTVAGALPPRERAVLAALVVKSPRQAGIDELTAAVWRGAPPAASLHQLHTAISRLRRVLGADAVQTTADGYRLAGVDTDDRLFEAEIAEARTRSAAAEPGRAVELYRRALGRWRSTPLAELAGWDTRDLWARRLDALRDDADEELLTERLAAGGHREVLPDAERRVREHPWRERGWAVFALALYRSGRQADALTALRAGRARLTEDLGLDPGPELAVLEQRILRRDPDLDLPRPPSPIAAADNPYRGLIAFGTEDAATFFGRDDSATQLAARIRRGGLVVVTGASGSGKTSLVFAGVVPRLEAGGLSVHVLRGSGDRSDETFRADVVILDQYEEIVGPTGPPPAARGAVESALGSGRAVVIVVRSDFLGALASWPALAPRITDAVHVVTAMNADGLRSAIEGPARRMGLRLDPGFAAVVLHDALERPGALPHLSHALFETWLRREGDVLTIAGYEATGGILGAVARTADEVYDDFDAAERAICRSTLLRLVTLGSDSPATRRRGSAAQLRRSAARRHVVDRLISARLLAVEGRSVTIAHEALLTAWPRLRDWVHDREDDTRRLGTLAAAAEAWEAEGRRPEDLWRGERLGRLVAWSETDDVDLVPLESEFLAAGVARELAEADERDRRARAEVRQNRRLRGALAIAAGLLVLLLVTTVIVADVGRRAADLAASHALEALVATSLSLRERDRGTAALLAAEAFHRDPDDPRVRAALLGSLTAAGPFLSRSYLASETVLGAGIPNTGEAALLRDGVWGVLDLQTGHVRDLELPTESAGGTLLVSGDGRRATHLEPADGETRVSIVDLAAGRIAAPPIVIPPVVGANATLSATGDELYAVDAADGALVVVDLLTGTVRELAGVGSPAAEGRGYPASVTVLADGTLAIGTSKAILMVEPATLTRLSTVPIPTGRSTTAITPVDATTVVASGDSGIALVDLAAGLLVWERPFSRSQEFQCTSLAPAASAGSVFCAGRGISEFALADGSPTGREFDVASASTSNLIVMDDLARVVTFGTDEPVVETWSLDGSGPISRIIAAGRMAVDGFEPGGTRIITAVPPDAADLAADPTAWEVWDTATDSAATGLGADVATIAWAGSGVVDVWPGGTEPDVLVDLVDGRRRTLDLPRFDLSVASRSGDLGYSFGDGWVQAYDPATGRAVGPRIDPGGRAISVSDSADGRRLAVWVWRDSAPFRQVVVFDAASGEELARGLDDSSGAVITPDGDTVVSNDAQRVLLSDARLSAVAALPTAGSSTADFPQLDDEGRILLMPTADQFVALYDIRSRIALGDRIPAVTRDYWPAGFLRSDGRALVVNVADGIALWDLDLETQYAAVCRMAGRTLTDDERNTYLADVGSSSDPACAELIRGE
jgi:DNA-binding SARP family transcriptional activator